MQALLWTSRSLAHLTEALKQKGYAVSTYVVRWLLKLQNYSLQANRKMHEGGKHPDRDAQFLYIAAQKEKHLAAGNPVLSIDGKKKELIGNYKNNGREWRPRNAPEHVNVYDFVDPDGGRATPYGIFDITQNKGLVILGISFDTARFAVNALRQWWMNIGRAAYSRANAILITADGGGSNGSRVRLWKIALQELANEWGLPVTVCHYPPGTSKWNPIEHKMFSYLSINWRGKPLRTLDAAAQYIRATTTKSGLTIDAQIDKTIYQKGIKISKKALRAVNIKKHDFHGEWNYTIYPQPPPLFWKH
jgi:DDE family transposase